jgi:uncharacterized protein (DUF427 family)
MKAIWNGKIIAEAPKEDLIYIEGNWYFPAESVNKEFLRQSETVTTCSWRGECNNFDVGQDEAWSKDNAWTYLHPDEKAVHIAKKDFSGYIAFWGDVRVTDNTPEPELVETGV